MGGISDGVSGDGRLPELSMDELFDGAIEGVTALIVDSVVSSDPSHWKPGCEFGLITNDFDFSWVVARFFGVEPGVCKANDFVFEEGIGFGA